MLVGILLFEYAVFVSFKRVPFHRVGDVQSGCSGSASLGDPQAGIEMYSGAVHLGRGGAL